MQVVPAPKIRRKAMLEVACNGMVQIVGIHGMGIVAVGYSISCNLGLIIKQNLFHKLMLLQIPTTEIYLSYINLKLESLHMLAAVVWVQIFLI
jgi:hypothetical protein